MRRNLFIAVGISLLLSGCTLPPPAENKTPHNAEEYKYETPEAAEIAGTVTSVTDGDTFMIKLAQDYMLRGMPLSKGQEIAVRLLLIDTPESVGDKAGMPYGEEASKYAKELLKGKQVTLEFDEGEFQDPYDRFLAYAYVDGKRVQDSLIENGFAMIRYIDAPNTRHLDELRELEDAARTEELAIWSIPEYVALEKGFNELIENDPYKEISNTIEEQTKDAAHQLVDETIDSLFESISGE